MVFPSARLMPGPLVLVAICLCGGTLVGLRFGGFVSAWILPAFALAAASLGWLRGRAQPANRTSSRLQGRTTAGLLLAATFAAGAASGRVVGLEAGRSCLTRIENGQALEAGGRLASPLAADPAPAKANRSSALFVRVVIVGAELRAEAGECSVPRLLALVRRPQHALRAGSIVWLRGKWSAYGRPGAWPRRPERRGYVRAKISAAALAGSSVEPADRPRGRPAPPASGLGPLQRIRAAGIQRVESRLPADVSPTAIAILLAERGRLDPATSRTFANAGLAHLLAISGLHVGILAAAALAATGMVAVGAVRHLAAALLVLSYVLVIGAPPAAVRAALIFCGYAASRARGSPARITDLLALAATLAILADPLTLLEPGFQLSFAGFSGLLLGSRVARRLDRSSGASPSVARRRTRRIVRSLGRGIGASAGAFALTAPIAAWHFQSDDVPTSGADSTVTIRTRRAFRAGSPLGRFPLNTAECVGVTAQSRHSASSGPRPGPSMFREVRRGVFSGGASERARGTLYPTGRCKMLTLSNFGRRCAAIVPPPSLPRRDGVGRSDGRGRGVGVL